MLSNLSLFLLGALFVFQGVAQNSFSGMPECGVIFLLDSHKSLLQQADPG
jgi:hypothetical protein